MKAPPPSLSIMQRWPIEQDPVFGCWLWAGTVNGKGYGSLRVAGEPREAHWAVYEALRGLKQRPGLVLDHYCRRRRCVNPDHLDPVTPQENRRRIFARHRRNLTHCPSGHRILPSSSLRTPEDGLVCKVCWAERLLGAIDD